jgi:hypothetical protein
VYPLHQTVSKAEQVISLQSNTLNMNYILAALLEISFNNWGIHLRLYDENNIIPT